MKLNESIQAYGSILESDQCKYSVFMRIHPRTDIAAQDQVRPSILTYPTHLHLTLENIYQKRRCL